MASLFKKLTDAVSTDEQYDDLFEDEIAIEENRKNGGNATKSTEPKNVNRIDNSIDLEEWSSDEEEDGELAVDVYQTKDEVVVKALVAGVIPNNIEVSLTRDMITVKGTREDEREVEDDGFFQRELYWGSFSRTILLPEEVDVDGAQATEKHGILMIRLPKVNKAKQTKLKVKSR